MSLPMDLAARKAGRSQREYLHQRMSAMSQRVGLPAAKDASLQTQQLRFTAAYGVSTAASDGQQQVWTAERLTDARGGAAICCRESGPQVFQTECQCLPIAITNPVRCSPACRKPIISSLPADPRCCNQNQVADIID